MNDSPTPPVSDEYTITTKMLMARIECTEKTLWSYGKAGLLPPGKRRHGVRLLFWTPAQANRLMKRIGCKAKPFGMHDRHDMDEPPDPPPMTIAGEPDKLVAGCVSHMLQMMAVGCNPDTAEAAQRLLADISGPLESRLRGKEGAQ